MANAQKKLSPATTTDKAWAGALAATATVAVAQIGLGEAEASTAVALIMSFLDLAPPPPVEEIQALVKAGLTLVAAGMATYAGVFYKRSYLK